MFFAVVKPLKAFYVKQLLLFQLEQLHGRLQDAATAEGEIGGGGKEGQKKGGMKGAESKDKEKSVFFFTESSW